MAHRFHVLGIPHTASSKAYCACAFTQKVVNLCKMLTCRGHHVIHYGNALSDVVCAEHVTVTNVEDIGPPELSGTFDENGATYAKFRNVAIGEIEKRKRPRDFLLCAWASHKAVADVHRDLIVVESGIGYPAAHFAPFKVFESYAMLHAYRGLEAVRTANGNGWWYDVVIPNFYDPADFRFSPAKGKYLLFLGLRSIGGEGKGINVAIQTAEAAGHPLIIAGPGIFTEKVPDNVEFVGFVDVERRKQLLASARAVLCPSQFVEPFCGVHVEAMLSGTPVITTDWGAFAEYNLHGVTGYRCRTFEQFVWAAKDGIEEISRRDCREWAEANFSLDRVAAMYDEYFASVMNIYTGKGWYEPRPDRADLDWLSKRYPHGRSRLAADRPRSRFAEAAE